MKLIGQHCHLPPLAGRRRRLDVDLQLEQVQDGAADQRRGVFAHEALGGMDDDEAARP